MNALIIIRTSESHWVRKSFPGLHPAMLQICNKPLLEYLIDFASTNGCQAVRVLLEEPGDDVERWFKSGQKTGLSISYGQARPEESLESLLSKNSRFCHQEPLLVYDGYFFLHYDQHKPIINWFETAETGLLSSCPGGLLLCARNESCLLNFTATDDLSGWTLSPLQSVDDYFQLTQQILTKEEGQYVLPGYRKDQQQIFGRNVKMGKRVKLLEPVIIGDHVRLGDDCTIGPGTVIGSGSVIDEKSEVANSLILPDSYLGRNLKLQRKIVYRDNLVLPDCGSQMKISDRFLLAPINDMPSLRLLDRLIATLLLILLFPLYIPLQGACRLQRDWLIERQKVFLDHRGRTTSLRKIFHPREKLFSRLFCALSLQRVPQLMLVVAGQLALVGNRVLPVNPENRKLIADFATYQPGVFTHSEYEQLMSELPEAEISERFYSVDRIFHQDLKVMCGLLLNSHTRKNSKEKAHDY